MKNIIANLLFCSTIVHSHGQINSYETYHSEVIRCEQLIVDRKIEQALHSLDALFEEFEFVFRREYKLATELSIHEQNFELAFKFLRLGIQGGWTMKSIKKSKGLKRLCNDPRWEDLKTDYDSLRGIYRSNLNLIVRNQIRDMVKKDQRKALGALVRVRPKAQERYIEKQFEPHSERQLQLLNSILDQHGYPGEQLIGSGIWSNIILSHHNSMSYEYNSKDTLYNYIRPKLTNALKRGEISPHELAQIDDWRAAVLSEHELTSFGFIGKIPDKTTLNLVNENRVQIGLRSIELRNNLLEIEKELELNLHLPKGWQKDKINIKTK